MISGRYLCHITDVGRGRVGLLVKGHGLQGVRQLLEDVSMACMHVFRAYKIMTCTACSRVCSGNGRSPVVTRAA